MKILMVTNSYPPRIDGVSLSVTSSAAELRRRGHDVVILAPDSEQAAADEAHIIRVPALQGLGSDEASVSLPLSLACYDRLDEFGPQIVHAHHPFLLGSAAARLASRYEVPLVFTHHTLYEHHSHHVPGNSPAIKRFVADLAIRYCNLADVVIVPSRSTAAFLETRAVKSPLEVVPTGIDLPRFQSGNGRTWRDRLQIPEDAILVGHVGRLAPEKNVLFLSRCLGRFLQEHPSAHALIAGDGPELSLMRECLDSSLVSHRVHFTGTLAGQELIDAYAAMNVFAFASKTETQGIVVAEAMAAGVPVAALDGPGVREIVRDGENGRLVGRERVQLFVDALTQICEGSPRERAERSEHAQASAAAFSVDLMGENLEAVYRDLLEATPRPKQDDLTAWETARRRLDVERQLWANRAHAARAAVIQHPSRVPVLRHVVAAWRKFRRWFSRREWSVKLLNLPVLHAPDEPGLILLQIDGLSRPELERALQAGRLPFLRQLIKREHYRIQTMYSGQPTTTPAVLGELFYGVQQAVPAFGFRDHRTGHVVQMFQPGIASRVQHELAQKGEGLLTNGAAYCDIYSGGAADSSFCPATTGWRNLEDASMWRRMLLFLMNLMSLLRIAALCVIELLVAIGDSIRGITKGHEFWRELIYIPRRVIVNIVLREWVAISVEVDTTRGVPVVHANFLGYDENAHRRGPDALFAHYALRGIDRAIRRIWNAAHASHHRNYQLWIMADHGQQKTIPYTHERGRKIGAAISEIFVSEPDQVGWTRFLPHAETDEAKAELEQAKWLRVKRRPDEGPAEHETEAAEPVTVAIGPVGYVYWPAPLSPEETARIAQRMVAEAGIPLVLAQLESTVWAWTEQGKFQMPDEASKILAPDHPHFADVARDFTSLCTHPDAGDFLICGWRNDQLPISFVPENGAHGGPGPLETTGFAMLPPDVPRHLPAAGTFRPLTLRKLALDLLHRRPLVRRSAPSRAAAADSVRVVTYNVHSCIGLDGRLSPARIARVLAALDPDIVALQELDVGRDRTDFVDQAQEIAGLLRMELQFHPSFKVEEEHYGNAVLSRFPMKLVSAGALPTPTHCEPRGAIWVEIDVDGLPLQLINTHLGLTAPERNAQVEELLGSRWLRHPQCSERVILCGDFNSLPGSRPYQMLKSRLRDAQTELSKRTPLRTWFGPFPLTRIDHVFLGGELQAADAEVLRTQLARTASDHLPLCVEVQLTDPAVGSGARPAAERQPEGIPHSASVR